MSLDLGTLFGKVALESVQFDRTYVRVVRQMADLGVQGEKATAGTAALDKGLTRVAAGGDAAAAGLGNASKAFTEAGLSASDAAGASSALQAAQLRLTAAQERLTIAMQAETTTAGRLASAQAAVLSATDRVAAVQQRAARATEMAVRGTIAEAEAASTAAAAESRQADAVLRVTRLMAPMADGSSAVTSALLRQVAAQERLDALMRSGTATTAQLATAQASLVAANDRVIISQERLAETATITSRIGAGWAAIPGPAKVGAAALVVAGVEALKGATHFQSAMELIHTQAGASQGEVDRLSKSVLSLAGPTATAPDELAAGLYHLESAGMRGSKAIAELRVAAEGARLGQANLEDVTNSLNAAVVSGIPGVQSMSQAMGALNAIVGSGDMRMQDLADALGTGVLAVIKGFGVNLTDAGAALATFGDNNIRGAGAATALRMAVQSLSRPATAGQAALSALGLQMDTLGKVMAQHGLGAALQLLHDRLVATRNTGAKTGLVLTEAFGKRAGVGLQVLEEQFARFQSKQEEVSRGALNFSSDWTATTKTVGYQWGRLVDGLSAAGVRIGTDLIPAASALLGVLNSLGHDVGVVTGFFAHNHLAAAGLATVLGGTLIPALARTKAAAAIGSVFETLALKMMVARDAVAGFGSGQGIAAGIGGLLGRINLTTAALTALAAGGVIAWTAMRHSEEAARKAADDFFSSLTIRTNDVGSVNAAILTLSGHITDLRKNAISSGQVTRFGLVSDTVQTQIDETTGKIAGLSAQALATRSNIGILTGALHMSGGAVIALADKLGIDLSKPLGDTRAKLEAAATAAALSHHPMAQAADDVSTLGSKANSAADDVQALSAALDLMAGNSLSADQAAIAFRNDIAALDKALHKSHGSMGLNTQAGRDARDAFVSVAQQALATAEAQSKLKNGTDKARATLQHEIATLKQHAGDSDYAKAAVGRLQAALDKLPASVHRADKALAGQGAAAKAAGRVTGADYTEGVAQGLTSKLSHLQQAADQVAQTVDTTVRHRHQSKSPSRVGMRTGADYSAGVAIGVASGVSPVRVAAKALAQAVGDGFSAEMVNVSRLIEMAAAGSAARVQRIVTQAAADAKTAASAARATLSSDISNRQQAAAGYASTALGSVALSGAVVNGRVGNLSAYLHRGIVPLGTEHHLLSRLKHKHLDPSLLAQIASEDPTTAIALARSILSGQSGSITHLNALDHHARALARATGQTVAGAQYDPRIARDRRDVHDSLVELRRMNRILEEVKHILKKNPHDLAGAIGAAFTGAQHRHHAQVGK